ncbi:hypothetical protein EVAR_750_1 [Eumeta japonica]|uniref:Uncharacterized protein n=1 Tax=Eumeta variegata TaxID=151549 RepID=A0A4C1SET6_EUMVA|nr:hypothetical protein EVAR_750_1 [Eumeta japonica]
MVLEVYCDALKRSGIGGLMFHNKPLASYNRMSRRHFSLFILHITARANLQNRQLSQSVPTVRERATEPPLMRFQEQTSDGFAPSHFRTRRPRLHSVRPPRE